MVLDTYVVGSNIIGNHTIEEGKCNVEGKAAYSGAVCSLYHNNLLAGNTLYAAPTLRNAVYLCINSCAYF